MWMSPWSFETLIGMVIYVLSEKSRHYDGDAEVMNGGVVKKIPVISRLREVF